MKGLDVLQEKLEKHRECLKDVDESIKKLTGRNQNESTGYGDLFLDLERIQLRGIFNLFRADNSTEGSKEEHKGNVENSENKIISLKRQPLSNGENNRNYRYLDKFKFNYFF